ncbi:carbohydrate kinase [Micractinium conductrix]|uniref:Carbohydrate kinase n=1 Tax=Micractinium conductrix TaxID=554055 RepID=A0A2P6VDM7_9CHLO|nr:carbohydrate kinase [Micractinium conductrix]|eukprot:PSC72161.1 carbohydrate kinase [Micractinium conductrix]
MPSYVIGVDGGTESLRAGVFDAAGTPLSFASAPYPTAFPAPGWAEQRPADWWTALGVAVKEAAASAGVPPADIAALCVDTTCCTVVALDEAGQALRPALLWMDMRSAAQAARVAAAGDEALAVNGGGGGPVSAEWMIPKALWLAEKEPEVFEEAATICEYQDYLNFNLTGRMVASVNNASIRWHYSTQRPGGWPTGLLKAIGLEGLQAKWPQEVLPLGAVVGGLTPAAAAHLGLPEGLPVAQGGADADIGMIGLGVIKPGQLALLTGSSHLHLGVTDKIFHGRGIWGVYPDALLPGVHMVEGGQTSTGSAVAWLRKLVGEPGYEALNAEAAAVPPGCEGLLCLDHFQGNRTPHTDALSRGAIAGLTLRHGRGHLFRALIEAICFGTEHIFETMRGQGYSPASVTVAGGATRSDLWLQTHADVSNVPFVLTKVSDAPALGCAILAAVAAGLHPDVPAACAAMVHQDRVVQPDPQRHAEYASHYAAYKQLYPALQPGFHAAAARCAPPPKAPPPPPAAEALARRAQLHSIVSPSILSADFANLQSDVQRVVDAGAEWVHVDVFDGVFVPNLTIGPPVVKSLHNRVPGAFLDCHLCVVHPEAYVEEMAASGAAQFTFHIEAPGIDFNCTTAAALAAKARKLGMRAGIALQKDTPASTVLPLVAAGAVDTVLLLSVRAGFGGQKFDLAVLPKLRALRERFAGDIIVDGGITLANAREVAEAGANALVAGTTVFAGPQPAEVAVPGLVDLIAAGREAWPAPASGEQPAPTNGAQQAEQRELSLA